jgi:uncharacterized protein with PQ loop repeat
LATSFLKKNSIKSDKTQLMSLFRFVSLHWMSLSWMILALVNEAQIHVRAAQTPIPLAFAAESSLSGGRLAVIGDWNKDNW